MSEELVVKHGAKCLSGGSGRAGYSSYLFVLGLFSTLIGSTSFSSMQADMITAKVIIVNGLNIKLSQISGIHGSFILNP
jgi:hypothetical protein